MSASLRTAIAAIFWGLWWIPLRGLSELGFNEIEITLLLFVAATVFLAPVPILRFKETREGGRSLFFSALLFAIAFTGWNFALLYGEVVRVTLLFYLAPLWGSILGWMFLGETLQRSRLLALPVGLAGAFVLLSGAWPPIPQSLGDWLGLTTGFVFAVSATVAHAGKVDGWLMTSLSMPFCALISGAVLLFEGLALPQPEVLDWAWIALAAAAYMIPITWALLKGAAALDPGRLGLLLLLEVVAAAISASILTSEPFGFSEAAGCALILAAGIIEAKGLSTEQKQHD